MQIENSLVFKIIFILVLISSVSCLGDESEDTNKIVSKSESKNGKYFAESFQVIYGQKGLTKVYHLIDLIYIVNEYSPNALISNDGRFLILYNKNFEKPLSENELSNKKLVSIYKEGKLISEFKLKDLFAFNSNVKITQGIVSWLAIDLISENNQKHKSIQFFEDGIHLSTIDGNEWVIDPNNGKVAKKEFNLQFLKFLYSNDVKNDDMLGTSELETFKKIVLDVSKCEFSNFKLILDENNIDQYFFECHLLCFISNTQISTNIRVKSLDSLETNLRLLNKTIKTYIEKNNLNGLDYMIDSYLYDLNNFKISGISLLCVNESPETLEFLNNSFMVRARKDFNYLETPYIIKFLVSESGISFININLN